MDILLEVVKWIIIVLVAGFIGQFGKSLGLHVIEFFRNRKKKGAGPESVAIQSTGSQDAVLGSEEQKQLKLAKKAHKARLKAMKKSEKSKTESS